MKLAFILFLSKNDHSEWGEKDKMSLWKGEQSMLG